MIYILANILFQHYLNFLPSVFILHREKIIWFYVYSIFFAIYFAIHIDFVLFCFEYIKSNLTVSYIYTHEDTHTHYIGSCNNNNISEPSNLRHGKT